MASGCLPGRFGYTARIQGQDTSQRRRSPEVLPSCSVPYAFREKVEQKLQHLQEEGTIEPMQVLDWAVPIVPVLKSDTSIRICGDFQLTVNPTSKLGQLPNSKSGRPVREAE